MNALRWMIPTAAITLVVVAWSETLYYPTTDPPWGGLALWYSPAVVASLAALRGRRTWAAVALAGWLLGMLVEGALVPVLYEGLPVSLVNPAIGWHMLVSALVGTLGVGAALRSRRWWVMPVLVTAVGVVLGGWWPIWLTDGPLAAVEVARSLAIGVAAVAAGHAVLLTVPAVTPPRWAVGVACALLAFTLATQTMLYPPAPLVLGFGVLLPVVLLRRTARSRAAVEPADAPPVPAAAPTERPSARALARLLWLGLLPLVGAGTYGLVVDALGRDGSIDTATMLVFVQMLAGTAVAAAAVVRVWRTPGRPGRGARSPGGRSLVA